VGPFPAFPLRQDPPGPGTAGLVWRKNVMSDQPQSENSDPGPRAPWQEVNPAVRPGELVRVRDHLWRVMEVRSFSECALMRLIGAGQDNAGVPRTLLWPFDRPVPASQNRSPACTSRRRWMRALRSLLTRTVVFGGLQAAAAAKIDLFDWQLEPALASVRDLAPRILLADEVGLGKTIQAGLIMAELLARGRLARAIILTPPGLRNQWADELATRFGIDATVVDAARLRREVAALPAGMNPWAVWRVAIASLDFVKRPEVLRGLASLLWDLLVVDEAHHTAMARERGAAVHALGTLSRRVVLLTATPHAGDEDPFSALCDTGRLAGEGPVVMFRRTRREVGFATARRVRLLAVRPTDAERLAHRLLDGYTTRVWREATANSDGDARLAMIVLWKRALSSMASLASSIEHRLSWLSARRADTSFQLPLPLADPEDIGEREAGDDEPDEALRTPGMADTATEVDLLVKVLDAARVAATSESKLAALVRLLRRSKQQAIVFTEYRDTLSRIADVVAADTPIAVLHGGLSRAERSAAERAFATGPARVLLATDVGGQGLNLHHRCRLVINMELPWSPVRVEQRIGRVDRIGQRHRVHAVHLLASGTGEELILGRLVARIERVRESIGAVRDPIGTMTEDHVAAAMLCQVSGPVAAPLPWQTDLLGGGSRQVSRGVAAAATASSASPADESGLAAAPFAAVDLRADAGREVERLRWLRRLADAGYRGRARPGGSGSRERDGHFHARRDLDGTGPWLAALSLARLRQGRRREELQLRQGLAALFVWRAVDGVGGLIEEGIVPILVPLGCPRRPGRRALRELTAAMLAPLMPALQQHAAAEASAHLRELERARGAALGRARQREAAIARAVKSADAVERRRPVQRGLFDRRTLAEADEMRRLWQPLCEEAATRVVEVDLSGELFLAGEPELVLVLAITP
jgi:superfamily II DNA or RNA helicase